VTVTRLPELAMDEDFGRLSLTGEALEAVKQVRAKALWDVLAEIAPDVFFVELYPFGRKAFAFELVPVLEALRDGRLSPCRVVCGVRDILVEKKDQAAYEARVLDRLQRFFDAVCVHADPVLSRWTRPFPGCRYPGAGALHRLRGARAPGDAFAGGGAPGTGRGPRPGTPRGQRRRGQGRKRTAPGCFGRLPGASPTGPGRHPGFCRALRPG
jgi:hypothetical protein